MGLIATNTLAQGDSREIGLDQVVDAGLQIRRSVKSRAWPSRSAVLEYCAVWITGAVIAEGVARVADGKPARQIMPSLEPGTRGQGAPIALVQNRGIVFQGSKLDGLGFTLDPTVAREIIDGDIRNRDVIMPYLNGQDLNSRYDCSGSRWVINFRDWPELRAAGYSACYERVRLLVKPERASHGERRARENWWRFQRTRPELYGAIEQLERVIAITLVSKMVMPAMVSTGQIFAHKLGVFATDDFAMLAMLSSAPHYWWTVRHSSTLETRINYSPSDVFETFAMPSLTQELRELGERLHLERQEIMLRRQLGLTKLYNEVFNPETKDADVRRLRTIHRLIDEATVCAYGWGDLLADGLDHGFRSSGPAKDPRYTVGPAVQTEILDRLLELNHQRYAEEVAAGLHVKGAKGKGRAKSADVAAALAETKTEEHLI